MSPENRRPECKQPRGWSGEYLAEINKGGRDRGLERDLSKDSRKLEDDKVGIPWTVAGSVTRV